MQGFDITEPVQRFQCKMCKNLYETRAILADHVLQIHGISSLCFPFFRCSVCKTRYFLDSEHKCEFGNENSPLFRAGTPDVVQTYKLRPADLSRTEDASLIHGCLFVLSLMSTVGFENSPTLRMMKDIENWARFIKYSEKFKGELFWELLDTEINPSGDIRIFDMYSGTERGVKRKTLAMSLEDFLKTPECMSAIMQLPMALHKLTIALVKGSDGRRNFLYVYTRDGDHGAWLHLIQNWNGPPSVELVKRSVEESTDVPDQWSRGAHFVALDVVDPQTIEALPYYCNSCGISFRPNDKDKEILRCCSPEFS